MRVKTQVVGGNKFGQRLRELQDRVSRNNAVYVGVPKGSQPYEDGAQMAVIAAAHEFGATINHPGGTQFGYNTEDDAREGRVRFLGNGEGFMSLGKTGPHTITLPERSFLRVPLRASQKKIAQIFRKLLGGVIKGEQSMISMLSQVGAKGASISQEAISSGIEPANSPSTVKRKGSSTPLVDTGRLKQAITYVIEGNDVA
jgi:phage gpG-like protein